MNMIDNRVYECVDENPESIPGSSAITNGAMLYFTVYQPVILAYLVPLMLIIELLHVLCVPSNNEQLP